MQKCTWRNSTREQSRSTSSETASWINALIVATYCLRDSTRADPPRFVSETMGAASNHSAPDMQKRDMPTRTVHGMRVSAKRMHIVGESTPKTHLPILDRLNHRAVPAERAARDKGKDRERLPGNAQPHHAILLNLVAARHGAHAAHECTDRDAETCKWGE